MKKIHLVPKVVFLVPKIVKKSYIPHVWCRKIVAFGVEISPFIAFFAHLSITFSPLFYYCIIYIIFFS